MEKITIVTVPLMLADFIDDIGALTDHKTEKAPESVCRTHFFQLTQKE